MAKLGPPFKPLGEREITILRYIAQYRQERGFPPSLREISSHLGNYSTSLSSFYLTRLQRAGAVTLTPNVARSIVITEIGQQMINNAV